MCRLGVFVMPFCQSYLWSASIYGTFFLTFYSKSATVSAEMTLLYSITSYDLFLLLLLPQTLNAKVTAALPA